MWRLPSRHQVTNTLHRITLTRLCLSNHKLAIETGCYSRPFKKPEERICPICKIEIGEEYHFLNICPAYHEKRCLLLDNLVKEYRVKISRMSPNKIFMFLINPPSGNARIRNSWYTILLYNTPNKKHVCMVVCMYVCIYVWPYLRMRQTQ